MLPLVLVGLGERKAGTCWETLKIGEKGESLEKGRRKEGKNAMVKRRKKERKSEERKEGRKVNTKRMQKLWYVKREEIQKRRKKGTQDNKKREEC